MLTIRKKSIREKYKEALEDLIPLFPFRLEQVIIVTYPKSAPGFWNKSVGQSINKPVSNHQSNTSRNMGKYP